MPRARSKYPHSKTPPRTELSARLQQAMREREMDIDDLQAVIFRTEGQTRLLYRGLSSPGTDTLRMMARYFDWDWNEALELVKRAKQLK
jgi:hypothetical protein